MTSKTKLSFGPVAPRFPALYRFIVEGPDFGLVYLVADGVNFDGVCVDPANTGNEVGHTTRIGAPLHPRRWERLAPGSTVTLTQE